MVIFILHCIESLHIIGQLIKIALIFYMLYTKYCLQSQLCMPTGILLVHKITATLYIKAMAFYQTV